MPPRRVILQPGRPDCDLVVYAHIDPNAIRDTVAAATTDAAVVEFWGEGTSAYRQVLAAHGGTWGGYLGSLEAKLGKTFRRTCLTTWSAGSQVAKDAAASPTTPDAIVMLDGLYGSKPPGAQPGDGKVVMDAGLAALAAYAVEAARGRKTLVILHSRIRTPYGSSKECAEAIQAAVERELRGPLPERATAFGRTPVQALSIGNLHILEYAGADAKEHIEQAHLYDEAWREWVPWLVKDDAPTPAEVPPSESMGWPAAATVGSLALQIALEELDAGVQESPPGSNKVKPAYWAGCTRVNPKTGREELLKVTVGPWCAVSFQWCSYEAARRLGLFCPPDFTRGPVPHGKRVSVIETQHDFTRQGLFHAAAKVRAGEYEPAPGDAVFLDRAGSGSDTGVQDWIGHLARYIRRVDSHSYEAIGGNEKDGWRKTIRRFDGVELRGFGAFPRPSLPAVVNPPSLPAHIDPNIAMAIDRQCREWLDANKGVPT
jgi:hypothetical protein